MNTGSKRKVGSLGRGSIGDEKRRNTGLPFIISSNRVALNGFHMDAVKSVIQADATLRTVVNVAMSSLLGGGVLLVRNGKQQHDLESDFHSRAWLNFTRKLLVSLWMYGIAAVVVEPHEKFTGIPRILDLSMIDVSMTRSIAGTTKYTFTVRSDLSPMEINIKDAHPTRTATGIELSDVLVYEFDPPAEDGSIQSVFMHVVRQREELEPIIRAERVAVALASNPVVYVQKIEQKFSSEPMPSQPVIAGLRTAGLRSEATASNVDLLKRVRARTALLNATGGSELGGDESSCFDQTGTVISDRGRPIPRVISVLDIPRATLPVNHQFANQQGAREPSNMMMLVMNFEERVGSLFGVPRSAFAAVRGGSAQDDPMGRETFGIFQRALKQRIIPILQSVHSHIFSDIEMWEAVTADGATDSNDIRMAAAVRILLPGVPPLQDMTGWYMTGVLAPESYIGYLSKLHNMPITDFAIRDPLAVQSALLDIQLQKVALSTAILAESQMRAAGVQGMSSSSSSSEKKKKPAAPAKAPVIKKPAPSVGAHDFGGDGGDRASGSSKKSKLNPSVLSAPTK